MEGYITHSIQSSVRTLVCSTVQCILGRSGDRTDSVLRPLIVSTERI